jgi:hypothetical protein
VMDTIKRPSWVECSVFGTALILTHCLLYISVQYKGFTIEILPKLIKDVASITFFPSQYLSRSFWIFNFFNYGTFVVNFFILNGSQNMKHLFSIQNDACCKKKSIYCICDVPYIGNMLNYVMFNFYWKKKSVL